MKTIEEKRENEFFNKLKELSDNKDHGGMKSRFSVIFSYDDIYKLYYDVERKLKNQ